MNRHKKRILLVDDEPDFVELIKSRLEANEYQVVTAKNGKEALDLLKCLTCDKFDAVLLDILMPEIDGLEVLKRIRQQDNNNINNILRLASKYHSAEEK